MNIPLGLSGEQTRNYLQRQINMGRYMIIGTVLITVVNLIFLLLNMDFVISYSAALAYYAAVLGKLMDNSYISVLGPNGLYTRTGLVIAVVVLAVLLVLWLLAKKDIKWIKAAMALLVVDTLALLAFAVLFYEEGILAVLWELVIHIAVLWEMGKALSARKQLQDLPAPAQEIPVEEDSLY